MEDMQPELQEAGPLRNLSFDTIIEVTFAA